MNDILRPFVPPLENGDCLTRDEFERRYNAMPHLKKAELIDGVVYMPSPVRFDQHASPHLDIITWLGNYRILTPGIRGGVNATLRLDMDAEPQPDVALVIEPSCGGQVQIDADGYIVGGPELVAEVAASTASIDLNQKFAAYLRNNVREYVVWRVLDGAIDWFIRTNGDFTLLPLISGLYQSVVFPGLWLDPDALLRLDVLRVFQVIQAGCATPEHAAFVAAHPRRS